MQRQWLWSDLIYPAASMRSLIVGLVAFYCVVYVSLGVLFVIDQYPLAAETLIVVLFTLAASLVAVRVARSDHAWVPTSTDHQWRERAGWFFLAAASLTMLFGRGIFAIHELTAGDQSFGAAFATLLIALVIPFFIVGVLLIPWREGRGNTAVRMLDAAIFLFALTALFWPIVFGPFIAHPLTMTAQSPLIMYSSAGSIFVLSFVVLWIVLRDSTPNLRSLAFIFVLSVVAMISAQIGYMRYLFHLADGGDVRYAMFGMNAATSLVFGLLAVAGLVRMSVQPETDSVAPGSREPDRPSVHLWQSLLPYPFVLLALGLGVATIQFGWRFEYRHGLQGAIILTMLAVLIRHIVSLLWNARLHRSLSERAGRDSLTGLFNHGVALDILEMKIAWARDHGTTVAVYFADIDHFKRYNDTFGHRQGNRALATVGRLLESGVRAGDTVARYGGEEFVVIATDIGVIEAFALGERLRQLVAEYTFELREDRSRVTISVGFAMFPDDARDSDALIEQADRAMYQAKRAGRNRVVMFDCPEGFDAPVEAAAAGSIPGAGG